MKAAFLLVMEQMFVLADLAPGLTKLFSLMSLMLVVVVLLSLFLARFKQSLLAGYFICGAVLANSGVMGDGGEQRGMVDACAGVGMVLLMFSIGLEFSVRELRHLWRVTFVGGGLQVLVCGAVVFGVVRWCGVGVGQGVLLGLLFALSSTAAAMKAFEDLGKGNSPASRASLGILLFQDVLGISLFVLLAAFQGDGAGGGIFSAVLRAIGFIVMAALCGRFFMGRILDAVARTRSGELFTLCLFLCCSIRFPHQPTLLFLMAALF